MANKKLTELPELQSADVDGADIIPVVDDISGTPITKKVTITNLMGQAPVQQADIADFATQVSLGNVQVSLGNLQLSLGTAATTASSDYATSAQGAKADSALQNAGVDLSVSGNILKLIDPNGTQIGSNIDLALYLDDTNLARITSGTLGANGIATFTRDDSSTFTIDLSNLTAVDSVNTQTGAVVLDADDIDDASTAHKFVTASDLTNLGNLSGTNTGDQDLSSYQLQPSEGAFVNGDKTKLDGIESSADVTDATNVTSAGALMDSEITNLSQVKAFDSSDYATSTQGATADSALQPGTVNPVYFANQAAFPSATTNHGAVAHSHADGAMYYAHGGSWVKLANDSDIALASLSDLTLSASPVSEDVVKYNGSAWVNGQVSVDIDTPLSDALRGTDNVHIGAHPQQSTKVMDSVPEGNAFMVADASGLKFLVKEASASVFVVKGPSASPVRLAEASELPSFSLTKDSGEPDVEITDSDGEVYSVISGDSDSLGSNGLPIRQGYQFPSIGSNPSPLLISGGTIS